jgi:hypothetical protein
METPVRDKYLAKPLPPGTRGLLISIMVSEAFADKIAKNPDGLRLSDPQISTSDDRPKWDFRTALAQCTATHLRRDREL